jgi:hypothetical protein
MFDFPLCSIYFNTLLVNLNLRNFVRNGAGINTFSNVELSSAQNSTVVLRGMGSQVKNTIILALTIEVHDCQVSNTHIKVQRETDRKVDQVTTYNRA